MAQEKNSAQEAHAAYVDTNLPRAERENERGEQRDEMGLQEFLNLRQHILNFSTSPTAENNYCK